MTNLVGNLRKQWGSGNEGLQQRGSRSAWSWRVPTRNRLLNHSNISNITFMYMCMCACVSACGVCRSVCTRRLEEDIRYPVLSLYLIPWRQCLSLALKLPVLLGGLAKKFLPSSCLHPTTLELQEHTAMTSFSMGARESNAGPQAYTGSTLTY